MSCFLPRYSFPSLWLWETGCPLSRDPPPRPPHLRVYTFNSNTARAPWRRLSPRLHGMSAVGISLAWFLGSPCWLLNPSAPHLEERSRDPPAWIHFGCVALLSCLATEMLAHLLSPSIFGDMLEEADKRNIQTTPASASEMTSPLHLTTGQVLPACILLPQGTLPMSPGNYFLFCLLFASCLND